MAITKLSYSSADGSTWAVSVNTTTGELTVDYTAGDTKVVTCSWEPA